MWVRAKKHQEHETKPPSFFRALCFLRPQPLSLWYESCAPFFVNVGRRRVVWSWRFDLLLWDELFIFRSKPTHTNIPIEPSTLFEFGSSYLKKPTASYPSGFSIVKTSLLLWPTVWGRKSEGNGNARRGSMLRGPASSAKELEAMTPAVAGDGK